MKTIFTPNLFIQIYIIRIPSYLTIIKDAIPAGFKEIPCGEDNCGRCFFLTDSGHGVIDV
jgi:hypothetical protein